MTSRTIDEMMGKCFLSVKQTTDELIFLSKDGSGVKFYHDQDCCETVYIEDVCGDLNDLCDPNLDIPIIVAEEVVSDRRDGLNLDGDESFTWTFYKFATIKGSVTVRWYGSSNGYYSEGVDIMVLKT